MGIIRLTGLEFFAYHGYHAEERSIGNRYRVDLELETDFAPAAQSDDLAGTVDYTRVYALVQARMQEPAYLLEHLAKQITDQLRAAYPQLRSTQVAVTKYNPPLSGICAEATVIIRWPEEGHPFHVANPAP